MNFLFYLFLCLVVLAVPANAAEVTESAISTEPTETVVTVPVVETEAVGENVAFYAIDGSLSGGYYFVADCILGSGLKFYVPVEWAHDAFTLDSSGAPVNMSTSTCYAFCPDFPSYTFSCSRFGTFTYRSADYSTSDLMVTNISDTNLSFMEDEGKHLSDSELLVVIAGLIFIFGAWFMIIRR